MQQRLLAIVDYDPILRAVLDTAFSDEGYRTLPLARGAEAQAVIRHPQPDVVLLDLWLERRQSGWALLEGLRADPATDHIPVIVCSADTPTLEREAAWVQALSWAVVAKPFELDTMLATVAQVLHQAPAEQGARAAGPGAGEIEEG